MTPTTASSLPVVASIDPKLPWRVQARIAQRRADNVPASSTELAASTPIFSTSTSPCDRVFDWATRQGIPLQRAVAMAERVELRLRRPLKNPFPRHRHRANTSKLVLGGGWLGAQDNVQDDDKGEGSSGSADTSDYSWHDNNPGPVGGWVV
jgi:hypothetical protein